ncbi:protein kinase [Streptomyces sp. NPDC012389]|uniref:protein kinase domain-containing protein n=1 Tax=Streptomyces sp. NPDC012389 TaxID=3364830 RepID=UPI0036EC1D6B
MAEGIAVVPIDGLHNAPAEDKAYPVRVIAGRYRLGYPIGAGGMGEVWHAYDERLDRRVAVKMMLTDTRGLPGIPGLGAVELLAKRRDRFLREIRITAALDHLGIPAIYDAGIDETTQQLYVVMQLLRGREVTQFIEATDYDAAPLAVSWAAAAGVQIASVLDEVHRNDIVHRDVKPANLMLAPDGVIKVLDFGIAALHGSGDHPRLTQEGMTIGTPPYMSPEQNLTNEVGPASDIYALACVLYELLTGQTPFIEDARGSYAWHHVRTDPPPIRTRRPDIPEELESLLLCMLDKEPERRLDASQVYDALLPWGHVLESTSALQDEFDPRQPFLRPFSGPPKRTTPTGCTPTLVVPAESYLVDDTEPLPLTETEANEAADAAARLAEERKFTQAADLLASAIRRAQDGVLHDDLMFSLAQVRFLAGAHREAAVLFDEVGAAFDARYGADDDQALLCRYYAAQCRMAIGEPVAAIDAFRVYTRRAPEPADSQAVDRYLDALANVTRLHAARERFTDARSAAHSLRKETRRLRGPDAPGLADINGFVERLNRFTD